jgi:imidazolonepropionase-like amidohydrolase
MDVRGKFVTPGLVDVHVPVQINSRKISAVVDVREILKLEW